MDKKRYELLNYISRYAKDGVTVVFELEDLKANTGKFVLSTTELVGLIETLTLTDFIKVSYSDDHSYCIALLPKARLAIDSEKAKGFDPSIKIDLKYKKIFLFSILGGFIGSFACSLMFEIFRRLF